MSPEWSAAAVTQLVTAAGAILVGLVATFVALRIAHAERIAARERWIKDRAESHEQWVRDQQLAAYIRFDSAFMQMQAMRRRRIRFVTPGLTREWQSATAALELLGSDVVRRQVYTVWALADAARRAPGDSEAWERVLLGVDTLRGIMQHELRIANGSRGE